MDAITLAVLVERAPRTPLVHEHKYGPSMRCVKCVQNYAHVFAIERWSLVRDVATMQGHCQSCRCMFSEIDPWTH